MFTQVPFLAALGGVSFMLFTYVVRYYQAKSYQKNYESEVSWYPDRESLLTFLLTSLFALGALYLGIGSPITISYHAAPKATLDTLFLGAIIIAYGIYVLMLALRDLGAIWHLTVRWQAQILRRQDQMQRDALALGRTVEKAAPQIEAERPQREDEPAQRREAQSAPEQTAEVVPLSKQA